MASVDITQLPGCVGPKDITAALAAGALTVTKAQVYRYGTDTVIQLTYSDASTGFIKIKGTTRVVIGGADNTFATGTEILWQS